MIWDELNKLYLIEMRTVGRDLAVDYTERNIDPIPNYGAYYEIQSFRYTLDFIPERGGMLLKLYWMHYNTYEVKAKIDIGFSEGIFINGALCSDYISIVKALGNSALITTFNEGKIVEIPFGEESLRLGSIPRYESETTTTTTSTPGWSGFPDDAESDTDYAKIFRDKYNSL